MSFDIIAARSYGTGALGAVTNPTNINSFASVTATASKSITINADDLSAFTAGTELLLHISGARTAQATAATLGAFKFAKIMSVDSNVLTLSTAPLDVSTTDFYYQAVTVPHYKTLTLSSTIEPPAFDETKGTGGILVFKCSSKLTMSGSINLVDKGLLNVSTRPLLNQEQAGTLDTDQLSGHENYDTCNRLTLQKGDGACLIVAKRIDFTDTARIGNPSTKGIARCRGADDSINRSSSVTNVGGSSILIAAQTINDFAPAVIAKYRSKSLEAGRGLARAYIATESLLPFDEGLYSYDTISTPERLANDTCINHFGSGSSTADNPRAQQNNYASVTKISADGFTFTLTNITTGGVATFERDSLVMIHASYKSKQAGVGRFIVATITGIKNTSAGKLNSITLNHSINELGISNFDTDHYSFQAIAIPQYASFTLSGTNNKTPAFEKGRGGIFAIAVNGTCDLSGGVVDVEGKGGSSYSLSYVSNARMKNRLPIGAGHGSVFILAKTLKMNTQTRLGSVSSGNGFGGASRTHDGGGYRGEGIDSIAGGSGLRGGINADAHNGGYCSNASESGTNNGGLQGASLFLVAQTINGLCLDALSTGGQGGKLVMKGSYPNSSAKKEGSDGGCGYGGGGATFTLDGVINNEAGAGGVHGGGSGDSSGSWYSNGGGSTPKGDIGARTVKITFRVDGDNQYKTYERTITVNIVEPEEG